MALPLEDFEYFEDGEVITEVYELGGEYIYAE